MPESFVIVKISVSEAVAGVKLRVEEPFFPLQGYSSSGHEVVFIIAIELAAPVVKISAIETVPGIKIAIPKIEIVAIPGIEVAAPGVEVGVKETFLALPRDSLSRHEVVFMVKIEPIAMVEVPSVKAMTGIHIAEKTMGSGPSCVKLGPVAAPKGFPA
jgi:hypothetical protein